MRLGADPDGLERCAGTARVLARRLAAAATRLRAADRRWWRGPAAGRWWSGPAAGLSERLDDVARDVSQLSHYLVGHARAQRVASMDAPVRLAGRVVGSGVGLAAGGSARPGAVAGAVPGFWGPDPATIVVVLVPGVGTTAGDEALWHDAAELWSHLAVDAQSAAVLGVTGPDRIAVVPWTRVEPPPHLVAGIDPRPARRGGAELARDVAGWRAEGSERVVLVGHSYGGLVAARAAAAGAAPDELVLLGAPGLAVRAPRELALPEGAELWSAAAAGDPVALLARAGLLHGADPSDHARALATSSWGHSGYLEDPALLAGLSRVVLADVAVGGLPSAA